MLMRNASPSLYKYSCACIHFINDAYYFFFPIIYVEAVETGWLPGDILDDIPSKFINGSLICEVSNQHMKSIDIISM